MSSSDHYRRQAEEDTSSIEDFVHIDSAQIPVQPDKSKKPRRASWISNMQDKRRSKQKSTNEEQGMSMSDSFYGSVASPVRSPVRGNSAQSQPFSLDEAVSPTRASSSSEHKKHLPSTPPQAPALLASTPASPASPSVYNPMAAFLGLPQPNETSARTSPSSLEDEPLTAPSAQKPPSPYTSAAEEYRSAPADPFSVTSTRIASPYKHEPESTCPSSSNPSFQHAYESAISSNKTRQSSPVGSTPKEEMLPPFNFDDPKEEPSVKSTADFPSQDTGGQTLRPKRSASVLRRISDASILDVPPLPSSSAASEARKPQQQQSYIPSTPKRQSSIPLNSPAQLPQSPSTPQRQSSIPYTPQRQSSAILNESYHTYQSPSNAQRQSSIPHSTPDQPYQHLPRASKDPPWPQETTSPTKSTPVKSSYSLPRRKYTNGSPARKSSTDNAPLHNPYSSAPEREQIPFQFDIAQNHRGPRHPGLSQSSDDQQDEAYSAYTPTSVSTAPVSSMPDETNRITSTYNPVSLQSPYDDPPSPPKQQTLTDVRHSTHHPQASQTKTRGNISQSQSPQRCNSSQQSLEEPLPIEHEEATENLAAGPRPPFEYALTHGAYDLLPILLPHLEWQTVMCLRATSSALRSAFDSPQIRDMILEHYLTPYGFVVPRSTERTGRALPRNSVVKTDKRRTLLMQGYDISLLPFTLKDLEAFFTGLAFEKQDYAQLAREHRQNRFDNQTVRMLQRTCRAYTKMILRVRQQESKGIKVKSPLIKPGRALMLRCWIPTRNMWMSDDELIECEKELFRAGVWQLVQRGDVVWNAATGEFANEGKLLSDGKYLRDFSFQYDVIGHLPAWINAMGFSPQYWHGVIAASSTEGPLVYLDLTPFGAAVASTLSLYQDKVDVASKAGVYRVAKYVYRAVVPLQAGQILGNVAGVNGSGPGGIEALHEDWSGQLIIECEGTTEHAQALHAMCNPARMTQPGQDSLSACRIIRGRSRPGKIVIRPLFSSDRLL